MYVKCLSSPFNRLQTVAMRNPVFRKLPIESFLAISSRLTKSKLQIESILKYTLPDCNDYGRLYEALELVRDILRNVDGAIGLATNKRQIQVLTYDLAGILTTLELKHMALDFKSRTCLREGKVIVERPRSESISHQVVLLDNVFIIYRISKKHGCKLKAVCAGLYFRVIYITL